MDAFIDSAGALAQRLLPSLGAIVLIALFIALIKLIKVLNNVNNTMDKIQGPVDMVVKVSEKADETCDKLVESRDRVLTSVSEGVDLVLDKLRKSK